MKTIFKYRLSLVTEQTISLPKGAKVLKVAMQDGYLTMWAEVDDSQPTETRIFNVVGTGHFLPDIKERVYIDTVFDSNFVWHVFEEAAKEQ